LDELKAGITANFEMDAVGGGPVHAFCGWFDVAFRGSSESPADSPVTLSTAPDATGATHWGQQVFYAVPPVEAPAGARIKAAIKVNRRADNQRLLAVDLAVTVEGEQVSSQQPQQQPASAKREFKWNIE
jgi:protein arginine N-methyltransferase 1